MSRSAAAALALAALAARAEDPLGETLVVTPTRTSSGASEAPGVVTVLAGTQVGKSKALDEALRAAPSFSLFRRSSSLVADPTSQGANLRGVGPSGVSRALVLEDGLPLNDGFGGWVYWGAVPRLGVGRVEIAPGASSALFGSSALGGVVQIVSRPIGDRAEVELQGGSFGTASGALSLGRRGDRVAAALDAEGLRTSGYTVVAKPGPVDHAASSFRGSGRARFEAQLAGDLAVSVRLGGFAEDQDGGTRYTTAAARQADLVLGLTAGRLEVKAFARQSRFDQQRARLLPDAFARESEELASTQRAPADDEGFLLQWSSGSLVAGADARRVFGRSEEALRPPDPGPAAVLSRAASGEQRQAGAFVEALAAPLGWLRIQAALRFDLWRNLGGVRHEQLASGAQRDTPLPGRTDHALTPRLAARVQALPWLALRAAAYQSFRAPTLNELYRPFQVGPVRTEANPQLGPESSTGGEAGLDLGRWVRATAFLADLDQPITNATVEGQQDLQMRRNLGSARIRGVELEAAWSPVQPLRLHAAWTLADARVTSADLRGRVLPQDPRHRIAAGAGWAGEAWSADLEVRWISDQFEDDLNQRRLPGFAVVDARVSRTFLKRWTVFGAVENALGRRYLTGLQGGVATLGQPFFLRAGVRLSLE